MKKNRTLILWLAAAIILYFTYMVKLKGNQGTLGFDEVITPFILQLTNHAVEDFLSVFEAVWTRRIVPCSAALLIVLTGLSRVAAGAHYPSDVITGFAYGMIWTHLFIKIYEIGNPRMIKTASEKGIRIGT